MGATCEYQPGMDHAKVGTIDQLCSVLGAANFDNRSFGLNDEDNVALVDRGVKLRLPQEFEPDAAYFARMTLSAWGRRPASERILAC